MPTSTYKRRTTKDLPASVDPAGVRQELPLQLRPSTSLLKEWTPEIIASFEELDPLTTLSRSLIPTRKFYLRPPTMRYGWKFNVQAFLDYAEQHGLTCWHRLPEHLRLYYSVGKQGDNDTDGSKEDEDDDEEHDSGEDYGEDDSGNADEAEEDGKEAKLPSWLDPNNQSFDHVITLRRALVDIVEKHNVGYPERLLDICCNLTREPGFIISIYTNYDLAIAPSDDDVEALRQALGLPDKPLWYLGSDNYRWRWWN